MKVENIKGAWSLSVVTGQPLFLFVLFEVFPFCTAVSYTHAQYCFHTAGPKKQPGLRNPCNIFRPNKVLAIILK